MPNNRLVQKERIATYARVMFESAMAQGGQRAVMECHEQAELVVRTLRTNAALEDALKNKGLSAQQRIDLVHAVFADFNPVFTEVLAVMAENGEARLLDRVLPVFGRIAQEEMGVTIVVVTTAVELDDHLREIITEKAAREFGTQVVLREQVDPSILGGIIMSANGKVINASVLSQLEQARLVLKQHADGGEC